VPLIRRITPLGTQLTGHLAGSICLKRDRVYFFKVTKIEM
jgi:hypothetical protein